MKNVLAIVFAVVEFFLLILLSKICVDYIFPIAENLDSTNKEDMIIHTASLPFAAFLIQFLFSAAATFLASWIATKLATKEKKKTAFLTIGIILFFGVSILTAFPQPWWYVITTIFIYVAGAYYGFRLALKN